MEMVYQSHDYGPDNSHPDTSPPPNQLLDLEIEALSNDGIIEKQSLTVYL